MNSRLILGMSAIILVGALAVWVFSLFERYEYESFEGAEAIARENPFLAAGYFFEKKNITLIDLSSYSALFDTATDDLILTPFDTLVINDGSEYMPTAKIEAIKEWIEQGGYLMVSVNSRFEEASVATSNILEALGISVVAGNFKDRTRDFLMKRADNSVSSNEHLTTITLENDTALKAELNNGIALSFHEEITLTYQATNEDMITFAQFEYGEGLVTTMTTSSIWTNDRIAQHDHLALLTFLTGTPERLFIINRKQFPSLLSLVHTYSPTFLWLFTTMVIAIAWYFAMRLGPLKKPIDTYQSYFSAHIDAAGEFYWRHSEHLDLLEAARKKTLTAIFNKYPHLRVKPAEDIITFISSSTQTELSFIQYTLYEKISINERTFTHVIHGLQTIRNTL